MPEVTRRTLIAGGAAAVLLPRRGFAVSPVRAFTPAQTEGPFYPDILPSDTDADLVRVADHVRSAGGEILSLAGRIVDKHNRPLKGAIVEIWQCDVNGHYINSRDAGPENDQNFQGFGRVLVDDEGAYHFRTIRPVPYTGRTPHIHFRVYRPEGPSLTTQMYVAEEGERNRRDGLYRSLTDQEQKLVTVGLRPGTVDGARWDADFDLVLPEA